MWQTSYVYNNDGYGGTKPTNFMEQSTALWNKSKSWQLGVGNLKTKIFLIMSYVKVNTTLW